ncbi:MAG: hypothetical protein O6944_04225 [Gammaproteobacteria bacterium]|nr:hypothetical protein [Gammaproteobacteria bacterium]
MQTTSTKQILINDREAIPVRGIPYVTSSFIKPTELCRILADRAAWPGPLFMAAHYLDADGTLHTMQPQEWRHYIHKMEHFTIQSDLRESGLTEADEFDDENYPRWEEHAIKRLPSGVFVWRDHLEHTCILTQAFIELYIGSDSGITSRKLLGWECGGALNLDEYIPPTMRPICMEGFEAFLPTRMEKTKSSSAQFPTPEGAQWDKVVIRFIAEDAAEIMVDDIRRKYTFAKMGFKDGRRGNAPDEVWATLKVLAQQDGEFTFQDFKHSDDKEKYQHHMSKIRNRLKAFMGLNKDPFFPYHQAHAYRTRFLLTYP